LFTSQPTNGADSICLSNLIAEFRVTIRRKAEERPTLGIERARISHVASFASGDVNDEAAVRAAITSSWPNGQTEG
jgi:transposase